LCNRSDLLVAKISTLSLSGWRGIGAIELGLTAVPFLFYFNP
jgi:hypothetical protein